MLHSNTQEHISGLRDEECYSFSSNDPTYAGGKLSSPDNGWDGGQNDHSDNGTFFDNFDNKDSNQYQCPNEDNDSESGYYDSEEEYLDRIIYNEYENINPYKEKTFSYTGKLYESIEFNMEKDYEDLDIKKEVNILVELIKRGKEEKIMFGMRNHIYPLRGGRIHSGDMISSLDFFVTRLSCLQEAAQKKDETHLILPLRSEIYDIILTGVHIGMDLQPLLLPDILKKHDSYLSNLKQIVRESIEKGEEKDVIVERDNKFYCIQYPKGSIVTPAKFLNNRRISNLDGILKIGEEGNAIEILDGKYHSIKDTLQMTFPLNNGERIIMTLSSEYSYSFSEIIVHMDEENCKIFLEHCEELAKEPRVSKVVEAAKSFVQTQNSEVTLPPSVLENVSQLQHSQSSGRRNSM